MPSASRRRGENSATSATTLNTPVHASAFPNAINPRFKNSSFRIIQKTTNVNTGSGLEALYHRVATNAISNTGGRAEDAKCHPGTRVEVINLIERWMDAKDGLSHMLWLSGPAGGGKTAIVKTVAERCKDRGALTANFFFFRGDPTRKIAQPLVATLVYQILQHYPVARDAVAEILSTDPLLLEASVDQQFAKLIHPLFDRILTSSSPNTRIILLIDGLDECDIDGDLDQPRIIHALHTLSTRQHSPFLILIASRPEARIKMAFNQMTSGVQSIFLDDQYSPQDDIRLFVEAEFRKIKSCHPSSSSLPFDWPSASDIADIVAKSSGQFIYAATVMRYIGSASTVPSLSLQRVKGIVPATNNSPFAHLDSIYAFILSRADDIEATRTILSMKILTADIDHVSEVPLLYDYDPSYSEAVIESCVSDLSAVVRLTRGIKQLQFYHASMTDFLLDQSRSGMYWIDINAFREKALTALWQKSPYDGNLSIRLLADAEKAMAGITHMLLTQPLPRGIMLYFSNKTFHSWVKVDFFDSIHRLYYKNDVKIYKTILRRSIYSSLSANIRPWVPSYIPYARMYLLYYTWFFKFLNITRSKRSV